MLISIDKINILRKKTGAGILDCKKALLKSSGDISKSIEIINKKGKNYIDLERVTSEGSIFIKVNNKNDSALIMSLLCETDFVSNNPLFREMGQNLAEELFNFLDNNHNNDNNININNIKFISDLISKFSNRFKEKIKIGSFYKLSSKYIIPYLHSNNKIGVIMGVSEKNISRDTLDSLRYIPMQIASMNPIAIDCKNINQATITKEKKKIKDLFLNDEKNKKILNDKVLVDKIIQDKLDEFINKNTLLNQAFVRDNSKTVLEYLRNLSEDIHISCFKRLYI
jgi:elongation factor Ts